MSIAQAIMDESRTDVERVVDAKLISARQRFGVLEARFGDRFSDYSSLHGLDHVKLFFDEFKDVVPCPACASYGAQNYVRTPGLAAEIDANIGVPIAVVASTESFSCPICELVLDGQNEVRAAGLSVEPRRFSIVKHREGVYEIVDDERWWEDEE